MTYYEISMKVESVYMDKDYLITQKDGDRGDSYSRTHIFYYFLKLNKQLNNQALFPIGFSEATARYEVSLNIYVRHPDGLTPYPNGTLPQEYIADPKRFSRDQQTTGVIALGMFPNEKQRLVGMFLTHLKRFGKYQNWDFMSPQHFGMYIRSLSQHYPLLQLTYPLLAICDLGLIFDSVTNVIKRKIKEDDTSDLVNHSLAIIQAYYVMPTPISYLARKIFKWAKPQEALDSYFRPETNAPPLNELYRPLMTKIGL